MTTASVASRRAAAFTVSSVILLSVCTSFPALLVAALAVPIQTDLRFGPDVLGASVAVFFATTSVLSRPLGRLTRAIGTRWGMALTGTMAGLALLGLAGSRSTLHLVGALMLAGAANAMGHPSVNTVLSRIVAQTRHGLAFGIKQASAPIAGLFGGIAVPVIALTWGWRWVLVTAAALAIGNVFVTWRRHDDVSPANGREGVLEKSFDRRLTPSLLAYAIAAGLGAAGANSVVVFLVDGGVTGAGLSVATAVAVFSAANVASIATRIGAGLVVDKRPGLARPMISVMLALGAGGCGLLALSPASYVVGAVVAAGIGWGWTGVMHYVVVLENPDRPETATGALLTGFAFGSACGPILLGQIADRQSYTAVWVVAGALCLASSFVLVIATHRAGRRILGTA